MKKTMKAAVLEELGRMSVKQIPIPQIKDESMLIKVLACAVCGSDLRILETGNKRVIFPAIIGHEISGEVVDLGRGIEKFKIGDKVAIGADVPCGRCVFCLEGMGNCCNENYAIGYQFQGGFAEYCLLEPMVMKFGPVSSIPESVSLECAALAEPLACCINGFERVAFSPGKSVLIIGAGPVGIMLVKIARLFGASLVILGDINNRRLDNSSDSGADYLFDLSEVDIVGNVMEISKGRGMDYVFTACPSPDAQETSIKVIAKRGFVNFFGGLALNSRDIKISSNFLHYREAYVTGSHGSTPRQHTMAMDLISTKRIDLDGLITHRFPLNEIEQAFDITRKQLGLKVLVLPNG